MTSLEVRGKVNPTVDLLSWTDNRGFDFTTQPHHYK